MSRGSGFSGAAASRYLVRRALAAERVSFGLVDEDLQSQHRDIVSHLRLQPEQVLPGALVRVAVHHALHQLGDGQRQIRLAHEGLLTNVTRGMVTFRSRPSGSCQHTCSWWRSSKTSPNVPSFSDRYVTISATPCLMG